MDRIIEKGECVFAHDWESGGLGAGAGCEQVYRWRGKFAFASADYGNAGPFDSLEEVLKQQDCLTCVTSATTDICCSLMTDEELAARLTFDDGVCLFRINGETWGYNPETGEFEPRPDEG